MNEDVMIDVLAAIQREEVNGKKVSLNMGSWYTPKQNDCGTTACLAGFAALREGWQVSGSGIAFRKDGSCETASVVGRNILGLTDEEECRLFYGTSDERLMCTVAEMMGVDEQVLRDKVADRAASLS